MIIHITYVKRYILVCSRNYFCHAKGKIPSLSIAGVNEVLNNTHVFSFVMKMQQWVPFALLSSCKNFVMLLKIISIKFHERVSVFLS